MINLNQNLNINGAIMEKDASGVERGIVGINVGFTNQTTFTFGFNILDINAVTNNKESVQTQLNDFIASIRAKMIELGYDITI